MLYVIVIVIIVSGNRFKFSSDVKILWKLLTAIQ